MPYKTRKGIAGGALWCYPSPDRTIQSIRLQCLTMTTNPQIPQLALNLRNVKKAEGVESVAEGGCAGCLMMVPGLMIGGLLCIIPFGFLIGVPVLWLSVFMPLAGMMNGGFATGTVECPYCGTTHTGVVLQSSGTPNYQECYHCKGRMQIPAFIPNHHRGNQQEVSEAPSSKKVIYPPF